MEEDIENKSVNILSPPENYESASSQVTFWWETLDFAVNYEIQIVTGNFDNIQKVILDTLVSKNKFNYALSNGTYQWRIRAVNGSSKTVYFVQNLKVNSPAILTDIQILMTTPPLNYITNAKIIYFEWENIPGAAQYRFQIKDTNLQFAVRDTLLTVTNFRDTLEEGTYTWRVKAVNDSSETGYFSRELTIDVTPPSAPVLLSPGEDAYLSSPVTLVWKVDPTSVKDSVLIMKDSLNSNFIVPYLTESTSVTFTPDSAWLIKDTTAFVWKVKSMDKAGNPSGFSSVRGFYLIK
ncbi:MAG: hypothetical protein A3H98_11900 [Bacteroidetes bacterium RIFCSPLOWO2_02_FULL_36_8]|nr:MAG: hypothetical protein A3H98_11900 [Bacteroidetes bacterium RIFCSPLOWO2_02_FULL_36_8]